jgi:hypothetical protein
MPTSGSSVPPRVRAWVAGIALAAAGCRGELPGARPFAIEALVDSLRPGVETAVGLQFRSTPRSEMVTSDEVRRYVMARLERELPPVRRAGMTAAYRLLGLLPDSLDLEALLLDLYAEQVAGYYDPETSTLYGVIGGQPAQLRLVLAHELVHALQHQYLPLDSLMQGGGNGDRVAATQAVLEGHATLASIRLLAPEDPTASSEFWDQYQTQVRSAQGSMPVFSRAPLVLRESLIFPYLSGAGFMRWWAANRGTPLPAVGELPVSTEQVLHPSRYPRDVPVEVRFADSASAVQFEDTLGELELQILMASFRAAEQASLDQPLAWGGDRYRVYETADGPALVWYTVWDGAPQADRFRAVAQSGLGRVRRAGYRLAVDRIELDGQPAVRVVHGPAGWEGIPGARALRR